MNYERCGWGLLWKLVLGVLGTLVAFCVVVIAVFTITEYKPDDEESVAVVGVGVKQPAIGDTITLLTMNTGFGALDDQHDLFTNGGVEGLNDNEGEIRENLDGMNAIIADAGADIVFLQEVDFNASRTFSIDESTVFSHAYGGVSTRALNYNALFVPLPLNSPMGHVESGIQTMTMFETKDAVRISLPNVHSWPVSTCQLKRCILMQEIPLQDSDKKLVIVNVHLEAYSTEEGKAAQSKIIHDLIEEEYRKGNYVIVGGDFNQTLPGIDTDRYYTDPNNKYFQAPVIDTVDLPEGFLYVADGSVPSCRFADAAYNHDWDTTQLYVLDGFLISPNIQVNEIKTLNEEFKYTDHNPVQMSVQLLGE